MALENGRKYTVPYEHDPIMLFMDITSHVGTATMFPEYLGYMLGTDEDDALIEIKDPLSAENRIGTLHVRWFPLEGGGGQYGEDADVAEEFMVEELWDLMGHPWAFRLEIRGAYGLQSPCASAYVQYNFFDEIHTTETLEYIASHPTFNYSAVHRVDSVTEEFIDWIEHSTIQFHLNSSPEMDLPVKQPVSTTNKKIVEAVLGENRDTIFHNMPRDELEHKCEKLTERLIAKDDAITKLMALLRQAHDELATFKDSGGAARKLREAIFMDGVLNETDLTVGKQYSGGFTQIHDFT